SALERRGYVLERVIDIQKVRPVRALGNPVRALDTSLGERIRCDAVAIALPPAPLHELASSVGAHAHWVGRLHGFAVQVDADGRTAVPWLFAAGRVAGLDAISSGEAAGRAAAKRPTRPLSARARTSASTTSKRPSCAASAISKVSSVTR